MRQTLRHTALLGTLTFVFVLTVSCGSNGDDAAETASVSPTPTRGILSPPFEGTAPTYSPADRVNFRELPEWRLPEPEELPPPPADAEGIEFHPPETGDCPDSWTEYTRPLEGFRICYPEDWVIDGAGYVTVAFQDRWYTAGVFRFIDGVQAAHVSIYAINPYALPYTYTRDCDKAYAVTFAGRPAVLCPDAPGNVPEARIVAYHVRTDQFDYFVNAVPYYSYDPETGTYRESVDPQLEEMAIRIAQTFAVTTPVIP